MSWNAISSPFMILLSAAGRHRWSRHPEFFRGAGIADIDQEHEPIQLRLGQRIGALLLDRVLGGQDEEGRRQLESCLPALTFCSCIACRSAACVLGGVRLISSASTILAKIGPFTNSNARRPG